MKILAIIGTNRKKGNITKLCEKILEGANENGHQSELINLYDYKINYCRGCWACTSNESVPKRMILIKCTIK